MKAHLEHPKVTFYYACAKPVVAEKKCLSTPSYDNFNFFKHILLFNKKQLDRTHVSQL